MSDRSFFQVDEAAWCLSLYNGRITLTVDRLRRERHELKGELSVRCALPGARVVPDTDHLLSVADFNLSSLTARSTHAKLLAERSTAEELDWRGMVEEFCQRVIVEERRGSPSQPLETYERPGAAAVLNVGGWRLLRDHPAILFADGDTGKSNLALYACGVLAQQGIKPLYADWELSGEDHRERLARLFDPLPPVQYLHCERPFIEEVDRIRREIRRHALDYLVVDSIGYATPGPPEHAEHATSYFRALRQIGIGGSLHLAHMTKGDAADPKRGESKPFGSAFWHNSARLTWFAKKAADTGREMTVGLFCRKFNLGRPFPAVGFRWTFDDERTRVARVNVADVEELAPRLPLWQRIAHLLRTGPALTAEAIADELGAKVDSVKKAISPRRASGSSMFVTLPCALGEAPRIALRDRYD